jgi:hypothetical protein
MKLVPSLRIAMRILGVCVIAWAAMHPAEGAGNAAAPTAASATTAAPAAAGT